MIELVNKATVANRKQYSFLDFMTSPQEITYAVFRLTNDLERKEFAKIGALLGTIGFHIGSGGQLNELLDYEPMSVNTSSKYLAFGPRYEQLSFLYEYKESMFVEKYFENDIFPKGSLIFAIFGG
jgi:hypothetical protein